MRRRILALLTLASILTLGWAPAPAPAATIDPSLASAFAAKAPGMKVDVLLLVDQPLDWAALEIQLRGASIAERRAAVVAALKDHAAATQSDALDLLAVATRDGEAESIRSLWTVNGIAFSATQNVVQSLGLSKAPGLMVQDLSYDMISGVMAPGHGAWARDSEPESSRTGESSLGKQAVAWSVAWINAPDAWTAGYDGTGVLVAHFDTGIYLTHPDVANRLWVNPGEIPGNGIDDDANGYIDDVNGWDFADRDGDPNDDVVGNGSNHGTHTAGNVVGDGTNGTQTGVAPGATIIACKVSATNGDGAPFSAIYEAHQYAIERGARVSTMSLGLPGVIPGWLMRAERDNGDAVRAAGVSFFNSAGNAQGSASLPPDELGVTARVPAPWHEDPSVPYSSRGGVIAVGGTAYKADTGYPSSSRGPAHWAEIWPWFDWDNDSANGLVKPDIVAPAVGVKSLQKPSGYTGDSWNGTSMACPHAAGVAALMLQKNPTLSPEDVDRIMEQSSVELGTAGKDNVFGSGRIDALAAVTATPVSTAPYIVVSDVRVIDDTGDGIVDPGEAFELMVELTNNSHSIDASSISLTSSVGSDPFVSVVDGDAGYPDLPFGGASSDNGSDDLQFTVGAGAPQGHTYLMYFDIVAGGGYQQSVDVQLQVGAPEWNDHDVGTVHLTVTDRGSLGYIDDDQSQGNGFGPNPGGSGLFIGSLWAGTSQTYVCNHDYVNADPGEWAPSIVPSGRVRPPATPVSDQDFLAIFTDADHAAPKGIQVTQHSMAWADGGNDSYVVLKYVIQNTGASPVEGYHAGLFCDIDTGDDAGANRAGTDAARRLSYVNDVGGSYYGIAVLGDSPVANVSVINNPLHVYDNGHVVDGTKWRLLQGSITYPVGAADDDWSCMVSSGPYDLEPGGFVTVAFALVLGDDLADLQDKAAAADVRYSQVPTAIEENPEIPEAPRARLALSQNQPNPFNPSTTIYFELERAGSVRLEIFDMSGRKVRTLVDGRYGAGSHPVVWDGRSDDGRPASSGIYLYRYTAEGRTMARKMVLVK